MENKPKTQPKAKAQPKKKKKKNYVNNADLMEELRKSRAQDKMTEKLGKMVHMLCFRYAYTARFRVCSSFTEDMASFAVMTIVRVWRSFDIENYKNPFAYFTQVATSAFYQYQNYERKHRQIKDEVLVSNGFNPSFTYDIEHEYKTAIQRYESSENQEVDYKDIEKGIDDYMENKTTDDYSGENIDD